MSRASKVLSEVSISPGDAKRMYDQGQEVVKIAKGSFGAIIMGAMIQSNASKASPISKAFPAVFKEFDKIHFE